ncbi:hypothetical protein LOAG_04984 [Loa loa]|uniref:Uncharacterized protein n=1 Tax=Loa loa TaxID=7209 RepID=A0A1S0U1R1_LOALO|nr:hypothetical protein LOAG_04984 [Loa loa]EFO23502.1 hypothetical protein LOAG_04984 [Loa loa]
MIVVTLTGYLQTDVIIVEETTELTDLTKYPQVAVTPKSESTPISGVTDNLSEVTVKGSRIIWDRSIFILFRGLREMNSMFEYFRLNEFVSVQTGRLGKLKFVNQVNLLYEIALSVFLGDLPLLAFYWIV